MLNFLKNSSKNYIAILDVRDGSVGGMLVLIDKENKIPEKVYSVRKELPFQKIFSYKRTFYATMQAINSVIADILKNSGHVPEKILCMMGPHLHISQTRIIKSSFDKPTKITEKLINELVRSDLKIFEDMHFHNVLADSESLNTMLDHKIMQVKLNGYNTPVPFDKIASDIEISVYVSMMSRVVKKDLESIISKGFHNNFIDFHSYSFALFDSTRGLNIERDGFVVVDVESELTEVIAVKNGIIEETASFPLGKNFLLRKISEEFNTMHEEAVSYLSMHKDNTGSKEVMLKIKTAVDKANAEWTNALNESLKEISSRHLLPELFFIVANKDCSDIFTDFVKGMEMTYMLILNKSPVVNNMTESFFESFCKNKSPCPDDVYFVSESVFANKIYNPNV